MATRTFTLKKSFSAPLDFVYAWCTDYRDDDHIISGDSSRRHIVSASREKYAWILHDSKRRRSAERVRIVTLMPPSRWHLDGFGEGYDITGDYALASKGKEKTELKMSFTMYYKKAAPETKTEFASDLGREWDRFKAALEEDYRKSMK